MKQVYTYQEMAPYIEQGMIATFTCPLSVCVRLSQQDEEHVSVTITLSLRDTFIAMIEEKYASIRDVLDTFDIDESAHIWEVG